MGEQQIISRIGELNGIIEHYCEHILTLKNMIGDVTINKILVTPRTIVIHRNRLQELKNERYDSTDRWG